jgi:hypothetical protein
MFILLSLIRILLNGLSISQSITSS